MLTLTPFYSCRGTVCSDNWNAAAAAVACRQLGFSDQSARALRLAYYGGNSAIPILMDDTECVGNETTIQDCKYTGADLHNCGHSEDAALSCPPYSPPMSSPPPSTSVRLVNGPNPWEGRVEVFIENRW
jgi:hypothetical protein